MSRERSGSQSEGTHTSLHIIGTAVPTFQTGELPNMIAAELSAGGIVAAYHERTKHHYRRSAASLGYMDWATQPDPFRRYDGAPLIRLPLPDYTLVLHIGTGLLRPKLTPALKPQPPKLVVLAGTLHYKMSLMRGTAATTCYLE